VTTMIDIDFLPLEYHQRHARRQVQPWRIIVVVSTMLLLAAAVFTQYCQRRQARHDLEMATAACIAAAPHNANWTKHQARLMSARCEAEMFTYLRHPWPRSQLLSAVVTPMPPEITLYQIQICGESPAAEATADNRSRNEIKAEEEKLRKAPAAQRDAKRLHEEFDRQHAFVRLAGGTTDAAALYRYLDAAGKSFFFPKVELRSIESIDTPQGPVMHFQAVLHVRPGYGQPGGPRTVVEAEKQRSGQP
jgi:hypothetical protein